MKKFYLLLLSLCSVYCWAQNSIGGYEYWFNNSYQNRIVQNISETNLNLSIPTTSIGKGIHSLHIQVFDDSMKYSAPLSKYFFKVNESVFGNRKISGFRYWFNDNTYSVQTNSVDMQTTLDIIASIDVNTLPDGINNITFQIKDNAEQWSAPMKQNFLKTNGNYISKYQYWFNSDMENAITSDFMPSENSIVAIDIDASSLSDGMNVVNIRYTDKLEKWSSTLSQFFFKTPKGVSESNKIQNYQYWIDDNIENAVTLAYNVNEQDLFLTGIDLSAIQSGLHTLYVRFSDAKGLWSQVINTYFTKTNVSATGQNGISRFQYWFGNDFANAIQLTIVDSPVFVDFNRLLDFPSQSIGNVYFNYRFIDNNGLWSIVNSEQVYKNAITEFKSVFLSNDLKVYPNPVETILTIEINQEDTQIDIIDISGKIIQSLTIAYLKQSFDLSHLNSGLYLLRIHFPEKIQTFRFIKK